MVAKSYFKLNSVWRKGAALAALISLLGSVFTFLETPVNANAAVSTSNLVLNLDAQNSASLATSSPTTWNSVSPATNTTSGIISGPTLYSSGSIKGLTFSGGVNSVNFAAGSVRTAGAMTLETWVNPSSLRTGWNIIATRAWTDTNGTASAATQDWHYALWKDATGVRQALDMTGNWGTSKFGNYLPTPTGSWLHIGFTYTAAGATQFFLNGQPDGSVTTQSHTDNATAMVVLGDPRPAGTYSFTGTMSKFRLYNAALSSNELVSNYLTDSALYGYAPVNTVTPTITGTVKVGSVATVTNGTWGVGDADGTTTAYQWQTSSNGTTWTNISGATSSTYTPVAGDATNYLRASVTKTNTAGTATATSSASLRVQAANGTSLISGSKITGLTGTVPNDSTTYNVTLATNNLAATLKLGTTTGLNVVTGYASTASYMATTIGASAPIISFRGTGTDINTALANVTYTSSTQQTDVVKLYYATAGSTATDTKNYIPIYDNNQLKFHYYAYKWHASSKDRAGMETALVGIESADGVDTPGAAWYLVTPRYQVEWDRVKSIVGQNSSYMGARADAGSANWYWPANTDSFTSATIFGTQSGSTVTATSTIFNGTSTALPYHSGEPNGGTSAGRSGFFYIVNSALGWDDVPLTTLQTGFTMETYGTAPFNSGAAGVLAQTVNVVSNSFDAPTGLNVEATGTAGFAASWNPVSSNLSGVSLSNYRLEYSTSATFSPVSSVITQPTSTATVASNLTANTTYYVRVFGVSGTGGVPWGAASPTVTVTTKSSPTTLTVVSSGGGVAGTDYTLSGGNIYAKSSNSVSVNAAAVQTALASGNVVLAADTVIIDAPLTWSSARYLTLGNGTSSSVVVNKTITSSGTGSQLMVTPATYSLDVKTGASIQFTGAGPQYLNIGGTSYTLIKTEAQLIATTAAANVALAKPLTLATTYSNALINLTFTGTFDGLGNAINGMKITSTTAGDFGLFAKLGGSTVRNLGLTNVNLSSSVAGDLRLGALAGDGSSAGTNNVTQVWVTGFINQTTAAARAQVGGLFGGATAGTLAISKSWSSASVSTVANSIGSGGIIGTNVSVYNGGAGAGNTLTIDESYSTGNILRDLTTPAWYGNAGIIGVAYGANTTIRNVFSWGNINSTGSQIGTSVAGISGVGSATITNAYTTHSSCGGTPTNCLVSQTAGAAVTGGTGFTTGLWQSVNGTSLTNLAPPTKNLYIQVVAPTDGSYSTISYRVLDSTGTLQSPLPSGVTISGTPTYSIASNATIGTYANVSYVSGLTLGGSSAGVYSLNTWITDTSVTLSKYSQTVTWSPTTNIAFGTGSFTASTNPVASGNTAITYSVASAGTTGCTVNSTLGLVSYLSGGTCSITATAAASGNYLGASTTVNFVIQNAPTLTIVATGGGTLGTNYAIANGVLSTSGDVSINAADLATALSSGSVQLAGNVIINSPITWSANTVLTLGGTTSNTVSVNAKITASGNTAGIAIKPTTYSLDVKTGASLVLSGTAPTLSIGGASYTLIETIADLATVTATGNFALAVPLSYSSGVTTAPIAVNFAGTFDGLGNTVNALSITHTAAGSMGFIKTLAGGTVRNLGITNLLISLEPAAATYNNNVGGLAGDSTGGTLSQVWTTGFIRVKSGSTYVGLALGGLVGDVYTGTLNINRSWSSLNINAAGGTYTHQVNGGLVGGTVGAWSATASSAGGSVTMNQVYFTGDLQSLHKTGTYGQGGLLGAHVGTGSVNITDAFSWGSIFIGSGATNYGGILGYSSGTAAYLFTTFTVTNQLHPTGSSVNASSNSSWSVALGATPGFTTNANFASGATGFALANLAVPYKNLFIRVVAPTDGSYGTMTYRMSTGVDTAFSSGSLYTITGTPVYTIASNVAISPTPYQVDYASGLTFTYIGSGTNVYKISNFGFATPVTISKYPQTITWAPTTSVVFGSGSITPSALASATTSITYAVTDAGTTGCTVNSTTAVITATSGGTCTVTATAANTGDYLASSVAVAFTIANASAAPTSVSATVGGVSSVNLSWTGPTPAASSALTGYEIIYSTSAAMTSPTTVTSSTTTRYITGLTPGTTYYFQVRAVNGTSWYGVFSSAVSASTSATASTTLTVAASGGTEGTTWKNSNGVIYPIGTGIINAADLQGLLLTGSVQLAADTVNINADVAWATSRTLTLGYATTNSVRINANIVVSGATGGLVITPATYSLDVKSGATIAFTGANTTLSIGGSSYTLIRAEADLATVTASGNFALAKPLALTAAYTAAPITAVFTGTLDGLGNAVSGLNISATATSTNGLFGTLSAGSKVRNLGVTSANIRLAAGAVYYRAGLLAGMTQTGSVSIDQVWTSGSITASGITSGISVGGIVGTSVSGTLSITKSWSNTNIDTSASGSSTVLDQGGIIGGDSSGWQQASSSPGGVVSLSEVYALGTQKWASATHRGIGGIFGLHYQSTGAISITDAFSWVSFVSGTTGNRGGILGVGYGSQSTLTRTYQATDNVCTADVTRVTATPNCSTRQVPGTEVVGITSAAWTSANGTTLANLATPKIQLYAKVVAPTDGSYSTVGYQFVDGTGTVKTLSTMNLSASGTPTYSIASNIANGTYATTYVSGLTLGGSAAANYEIYPWPVTTSVAITKQAQTISFTSTTPTTPKVGQTYSVTATSTSALAVTVTIDSTSAAICSISGSTVTFNAVGDCVVNANQSGSTGYTAAAQKQQTITVAKGAQTISFISSAPTAARFNGEAYFVTAIGGASGNAVVLTVDSTSEEVCEITASSVTFIGLGTCTINANQAGNTNFDAASQIQQSFTVAKATQTLTSVSTAPTTAAVSGSTYLVSATGGTSGNAVTYVIDSTASAVCSLSDTTVSFLTPGTCLVNINQAGNDLYEAATQVQQSFTVSKGTQVIEFTSSAPNAAKVGGSNYTVTATGGASGSPILLTVDASSASNCSVAGMVVTYLAVGDCVLNLNQAGDANYNAATQVQQTVTITTDGRCPNGVVSGNYCLIRFNSSGTWTVPAGVTSVDMLAVGGGGGGGGGSGSQTSGGGGGGGEVIENLSTVVVPGTKFTISVGSGGSGGAGTVSATATGATAGGSTSISASGFSTLTARGGGQGASWRIDGTNNNTGTSLVAGGASYATGGGGSAQVASRTNLPGVGAISSGGAAKSNDTDATLQSGGGGGGAGGNGSAGTASVGGAGGIGKNSVILNTLLGGGGGGSKRQSISGSAGTATAGGGAGGLAAAGTAGTANTGGGGGGSAGATDGANGGSGVVVIRVALSSQTVAFSSTAPTDLAYGTSTTYTPTAAGTDSESSVVITVDATSSSVCEISSGEVSIIGAGTCTLNANQAGNGFFSPATQVQQSFTVAQGEQSIEFSSSAPTGAVVSGSTYTPAATSTSDGLVLFTIDAASASVCSITLGIVSFQSAGTCKVLANQAGDENWNVASEVFQSFTVGKGTTTLAFTSTATNPKVNTTYIPVATSSGTGTVSFAIDATSSSVCSIEDGVVYFSAVGTCKVNASQVSDTNWLAISLVQQTITVIKGDQTISFTTIEPSEAVVAGETYTPNATATSTGLVELTIDEASSSACSIDSGVVSFDGVGTCKVLANQAGDENWNPATESFQSFEVGKGTPALVFSSTATAPKVNTIYTPAATSVSTGVVSFTIDDASVSVCSITNGVVAFEAVGSCVVNAAQASDSNWIAVDQVQQVITVIKGDQTVGFTSTAPTDAVVAGNTYSPVASSTSGGVVDFAVDEDSVSICSITGGVVSFLAAGECVLNASQAGDDNWNASTVISQTIEVGRGVQVVEFTSEAPAEAVVGGATYTPAASGGASGAAVTFRVDINAASVCSISNGVVRFVGVGTCLVNADQNGDVNYLDASQVQQSFTVAKGSQTISFTSDAPDSAVVGGATYTPAASGGASGNNVVFSVAAESELVCELINGVVSFLTPGDCVVGANQAGNTNYLAANETTQTIAVAKGYQAISFASVIPVNAKVDGNTYEPVVTAGPSEESVVVSIAEASSSVCSVTDGVVSFAGVGDCVIYADQAGDTKFEAATRVSQTVSVAKGLQSVMFTSTPPSLRPVQGTTYVPTASSGNSGLPVVFTIAPESTSLCEITNGVISFLAVGDCVVYADQAGNDDYTSATRVSQVFDITKGEQVVAFTSAAPTTAVVGGSAYTASVSRGAGTSPVVYSISELSAENCSVTDGEVSFEAAGTCILIASQAGDANYNAATPVSQTFMIGKGTQTIMFGPGGNTATVGGSVYTPVVVGGLSVAENVFSIATDSSEVCSWNGTTVSFLTVGECVIEANRAGDANYLAAGQATKTITVAKGVQATLVATSSLNSLTLGGLAPTAVLSTTGGSGTGEVVWSVNEVSATVCSISGEVVTGLATGYCDVTATKLTDTNYLEATATVSIAVSAGGQAPLRTTVSNNSPTYAPNLALTLGLSGGDGTGAVWFESLTPLVCSTSGTAALSVLRAGECVIVGHKEGDVNFEAGQNTLTFTIAKANQPDVAIEIAEELTYSPDGPVTSQLSFTGVLSGGIQEFSVIEGSCQLVSDALSALEAGTCVVEGNVGGDVNYLASTVQRTFTIAKAVQENLVATVEDGSNGSVAWAGQNVTRRVITGGSGTANLAATTATPAICSVTMEDDTVVVTGLTAGTCAVTATKPTDTNYLAKSTQFDVNVFDLPAAPQTFTVTNAGAGTEGNLAATVAWVTAASNANTALLTGYEVQTRTAGSEWATVENGVLDSTTTAFTVEGPAWSQLFIRVAPISALDSEDDSTRNWVTLTEEGSNVEVPFDLAGELTRISTTLAAVTSGEVVTLEGTGFDPLKTTRVQITTGTAVFTSSIGRAAAVNTKTVAATVLSPTKLTFVLPKITMPKGRTTLPAQVQVLTVDDVLTEAVDLTYIPKKLTQTVAVTGLPATKTVLNIAAGEVSGIASSTGVAPEVTATPASVCTASIVNGEVEIDPIGRGTCAVTVRAPATPGYTVSATKTYSYTIKGAAQTLTFTNPGPQTWSTDVVSLIGTATLNPVFTSKTPTVCTTNGSSLNMVKAGLCTVVATQPGDSLNEPATVGATKLTSITQSFTIAKKTRTTGLTATLTEVLADGSKPERTLSFLDSSIVTAPNISVVVGENPLELPVRLNRAEGNVLFSVASADASRCVAEPGSDDPTLALITVSDLGSCKVTITLPADDRWNAHADKIVIWINAALAPDGVNPSPTGTGDGQLADQDLYFDNNPLDKDSDPAVLLAQTGESVTANLGGDLSMAYDAVTGKYQFRSKTLLVGKYTAKMTGPDGTAWFAKASTITQCTKFSKGKCVKSIKVPVTLAVNECVATLTVKKNPKLKKRVLRIIGSGCQLNDAGKAAFNQEGVQNIIFKYQWIRQYPSTGLDHVKKGKTKVRSLKKVKRTVVLSVGRPAN